MSAENPLKKEFQELFRASGWSQAEAARQLEMTRGGINGIVTGGTIPSMATVKLFRLLVSSRNPKATRKIHSVQADEIEPATVDQLHEGNVELTPMELDLLAVLRRFSPAQQNQIIIHFLNLAKALSSPAAESSKYPKPKKKGPRK